MRLFLSGSTGFIGHRVLPRLLDAGHEVIALVRSASAAEALTSEPSGKGSLRVEVGDLNDRTRLRSLLAEVRPEAALHLAWYVEPGHFWSARQNLDCVAESLRLAQDLLDFGCRRLAGAGTCAEYDWSEPYPREDSPCRPASLYGLAKDSVRRLWSRACEAEGASLLWLRYGFLYGPGERPQRLVPAVARALLAGESPACSSGEQVRDFLYVDDLADATVAALESDWEGPLNVGSGEPLPVKQIVNTLAELIGGPGKPRLGARPTAPGDPALLVPDTTSLREAIGWRPRTELRAGLLACVRELRNEP